VSERRNDLKTRAVIDRALAGQRRSMVRYELTRIGVLVLLVVSVWLIGYQGRQEQVDAVRRACERGKLDRVANAHGWRTAETARRATASDRGNPDAERASAALAADRYSDIAGELEERSRINCATAFPDASLLPF
jgi:stage III sporulation protein SpoIIIAA